MSLFVSFEGTTTGEPRYLATVFPSIPVLVLFLSLPKHPERMIWQAAICCPKYPNTTKPIRGMAHYTRAKRQ